MRGILALVAGFGLFVPTVAMAAGEKVAVADFDFVDTSGEVRDQSAVHAARLKELQQTLAAALNHTGRFDAVGLTCAAPPCSADNLDAGSLTDAAKKAGAGLMVFGGVHKISTLITFGRVAVVDVATGRSVLNRDITFRGDDEDAWKHADSYIADIVVQALPGGEAKK
jgi:hypothetical protein